MLFERLRNVRSILACQSRIVPKNHTILHEAGHGLVHVFYYESYRFSKKADPVRLCIAVLIENFQWLSNYGIICISVQMYRKCNFLLIFFQMPFPREHWVPLFWHLSPTLTLPSRLDLSFFHKPVELKTSTFITLGRKNTITQLYLKRLRNWTSMDYQRLIIVLLKLMPLEMIWKCTWTPVMLMYTEFGIQAKVVSTVQP